MPLRIISSVICGLLLSVAVPRLQGQSPHFHPLTQAPNFQGRLLCQDEKGFVWAGGEEGLFRYDGLEWEVFPLPDSLKDQAVSCIQKAWGRGLWVGFAHGWIMKIVPGMPPLAASWEKVASHSIRQVLAPSSDQLWVATAGEGLLHRSAADSSWNLTTGLPDDYVYALASDIQNRLWVATDRGIAILDTNSHEVVEVLNRQSGLPDEIVRALAPDDSGMWIGTYDGGISFYAEQSHQIRTPMSWAGGPITSLVVSPSALWIGTERQGIWHRSPAGRLHRISEEGRNRIYQLMLDQEGNLWACGQPFGLQLAVSALLHFEVPGQTVLTLHCGKDDVWFATEQGLFALRPDGRIEPLSVPVAGRISCLFEDQLSYLWVGTQDNGAWRIHPDRKSWQHITQNEGLVSDHILSISGDERQIWFATFGGAAACPLAEEIKPRDFQHYNQEDGLGVNYIYQAYIDSRDRVWFATDGKGLRVWENGKIRTVPELESATFLSIEEDEGGQIWFHSSDSGLYRWDIKKGGIVPAKENTHPANVNSILADGGGRILLAGQKGLEIFSPYQGTRWHFGPEEGVAPIGPNLHQLSRDRKGQIWIGTQDGLLCYHPRMLPLDSRPRAELRGVSLLLEDIQQNSPARFAHDENHISISYSGLWFQNPQAISFQHRLVGLDLDWVASNNREVIYPRLDPGQYRFEVRSSANHAFEQAPLAEYQFEILPPFWTRWWFVGPVAVAVFSLLVYWMRSRENRLRRTERLEKNYLAAQFETLKNQVNPHFLFNSFNTLAAIIEDQPKEAVAYLEHLSDLFRNILDFRETSVISIDEELHLLDKFYYLQRHRYGDNFRLEVEVAEDVRKKGIPPLTLQMLVENALKHNIVSRRQPLTVRIESTPDAYLSIRNNLQLRRDHQASTHIGQQNIRQRYQLLGNQEVHIEISQTHYTVLVPFLAIPEL